MVQLKDSYTLLIVQDVAASRDWWVRHLGFSPAAEADWFTFLTTPGPHPFGVCFMRDGLDHQLPQFRSPVQKSDSVILTLEVEDADAALRDIQRTGVTPEIPMRDEPWGQRHFMLRDPAGVWVDIVQQTQPDPAFA